MTEQSTVLHTIIQAGHGKAKTMGLHLDELTILLKTLLDYEL